MYPIQEPETGFTNIDNAMRQARAKYATNPDLLPKVTLSPPNPTPQDADFDEHYGLAYSRTKSLISEATTQLTPLHVLAPDQLTVSEWQDAVEARRWEAGYRRAEEVVDRMMGENQLLYEEVDGLIDDADTEGLLFPGSVRAKGEGFERRLGELRGVPEDVKQWVRESKMRWREDGARAAAWKPVMVVSPGRQSSEDGRGSQRGGVVGEFLKRVLSVKKQR